MRSFLRLTIVSAYCFLVCPSAVRAQDKLKIAILPKGDERSFWKAIHTGAQAGGDAAGKVEVQWLPPKNEQDASSQIQIVEQCIKDSVAGIVIAPLDYSALAAPLAQATKKGIPVVVFDSRLKGEPGKDFVSFIATDSRNGGALAGEEMARLLGGKGKVVVLRYEVGQANISEREEGFIKALGKYKDIRIDAKSRSTTPTVEDVTTVASGMAEKLKTADGVFCASESITTGMLQALRKMSLAGKIKFIGFDTSGPLVDALKNGEIDALVAQDPTKMGYFAVKTIVDHIRGIQAQPTIDISVRIITRSNLEEPEIQRLLALPSLMK